MTSASKLCNSGRKSRINLRFSTETHNNDLQNMLNDQLYKFQNLDFEKYTYTSVSYHIPLIPSISSYGSTVPSAVLLLETLSLETPPPDATQLPISCWSEFDVEPAAEHISCSSDDNLVVFAMFCCASSAVLWLQTFLVSTFSIKDHRRLKIREKKPQQIDRLLVFFCQLFIYLKFFIHGSLFN